VQKTSESVTAFVAEHRGEEREFLDRAEGLLDRCRRIAERRNSVVHSAYIFLESGGQLAGILRSDLTAKNAEGGDVAFDQEILGEESFKKTVNEIAEVAFELGQCRLQLIHWSRR